MNSASSVKRALRFGAWRLFPHVMAERAASYQRRLRASRGVHDLASRFVERHGSTVLHGPFAGLVYPVADLQDVDAPVAKLLGCYEEELHHVFRVVLRSPPEKFIDLGCADGYYAVGYAKAAPTSVVHAFELARSARKACRSVAAANEIGRRLHLHGRATSGALRRLPLAGSLVLCDCEGAEFDILDEAAVDALSSSIVIVELHEAQRPGVTAELRRRFERSHHCELVQMTPRDPRNYPELDFLLERERSLAVEEMRPDGQQWGIFSPASA
jgi:hypothetical protein